MDNRRTNNLETISNKTDIKDTVNTLRNSQGAEQQGIGSGVRNTPSATIKTNSANGQAEGGARTAILTTTININNNNTKDHTIIPTATNGSSLHKLSNGGHVITNDWNITKGDVNQSNITKRYNVNGVDIIEGMPTKDIIDIPRIRQSQQIDPHSEIFPDDTSLFIGDLSRHVSETNTLTKKKKEHMLEIFSQFGEVEHVDIKRDKVTKNNLGYGFVTFKVVVRSVLVGHKKIPIYLLRFFYFIFCQIFALFTFLKAPLEIVGNNSRFIYFGNDGQKQTHKKKKGFVKFKHRTHAEKAKATLDGKFLTIPGTNQQTERPIRIGWGDANTQRNCVHVQFDSTHVRASGAQVDLKESDFNEVFQQFGVVVKVSLPRFPDKKLKGYGFIHFEENDDGYMALF
ncbi:hypothetical protein RFI_29961 [Reticulomyxa filosa]|uniref:RRM domain-containing protein n=1 Tax=Reticulomyxa filosa TaxID=46433 RepID=X6M1Z8_RETFI|nr:hypothetical protein RFI_29961 [Reticulomyxa filosa]|eukprot:ETO07427.1 hypothetical protein RFI_29961 [Reticulomyxa filosa]